MSATGGGGNDHVLRHASGCRAGGENTGYNNLRSLIIGKMYSSSDLAYYNKGKNIPNLIVTNVNTSIDSVLLPVMSREQDYSEHIKSMTRRAIKTSTYVMAPMMMGIAFAATPLIRILLTEKWLPCVLYLRVFCITYMFYPIHTANLNAIKAMGRSDIFLKLEIIKKVVGIVAIFVSMSISVEAMAYSLLVTSVISQLINARPNRKLLGYGYMQQLKDILPGITLAVVMGITILPFNYIALPDIFILLLQVVVGILVYIIGSIVFKVDSFYYILEIVKPIFSNFRKRIKSREE